MTLDVRKYQSMKKALIALLTIVLLAVSSVAFAAELSFGDIWAVSFAAILPLIVAAGDGNLSEVKRLLDNGANANDKDENGVTAIINAVWKGQNEVVKVLLEHGANINYKKCLWSAVVNDYSKVVKILLDNGANVNATNKESWTALMFAVQRSHSEVAKLLLEYGANPDIKNKNGETAWDYAKDKPIILATLEKYRNDAK